MVSPPSISNEVLPEVYGAAEGSEGSEGSTELGTRVEESELLKLLRSAGLEEWHSKLLSFGYETVDDVRCMDEHCMEEIGLRGGHRIRLERVLPNTVGQIDCAAAQAGNSLPTASTLPRGRLHADCRIQMSCMQQALVPCSCEDNPKEQHGWKHRCHQRHSCLFYMQPQKRG